MGVQGAQGAVGDTFQFQLVRLQSAAAGLVLAPCPCFNSNWFDYSIARIQAYTAGIVVSIPTGSITVCLLCKKVSLSDCFNSNWFDYSQKLYIIIIILEKVSIPTGSITVISASTHPSVGAEFQFQLVRLQCNNEEHPTGGYRSFNSNWFDYSQTTSYPLFSKR